MEKCLIFRVGFSGSGCIDPPLQSKHYIHIFFVVPFIVTKAPIERIVVKEKIERRREITLCACQIIDGGGLLQQQPQPQRSRRRRWGYRPPANSLSFLWWWPLLLQLHNPFIEVMHDTSLLEPPLSHNLERSYDLEEILRLLLLLQASFWSHFDILLHFLHSNSHLLLHYTLSHAQMQQIWDMILLVNGISVLVLLRNNNK